MLLESALADFSVDLGPRSVSKVQRPELASSKSEPFLGKPKRFSKSSAASASTSDAGPTKIKHVYQQQQRDSHSQAPRESHPDHHRQQPHHSNFKVPQRRQAMGSISTNSSVDLSRSPPPLDPAFDTGSVSGRMSSHRSPVSAAMDGRDPQRSDRLLAGRDTARTGKSDSFVRSAFRVSTAAPDYGASVPDQQNSRRTPNTKATAVAGPAGGMKFGGAGGRAEVNSTNNEIEIAETQVGAPTGKPKLKREPSGGLPQHQTSQQRPSLSGRASFNKEKTVSAPAPVAAPHRTLGSVLRPPMSRASSLNKDAVKQQQQQKHEKGSMSATKSKPATSSKSRSRDPAKMKLEMESVKSIISGNQHCHHPGSSDEIGPFGRPNVDLKHRDRSPVSILDRVPSPQTTNSSGSSGSTVSSKRPQPSAAAAAPSSAAPAPNAAPDTPPPVVQKGSVPGLAMARRGLPTFSTGPSGQAQESSPRLSTSSSASYTNHCLSALQDVIAVDPERSKRFEESFVELDKYGSRGQDHNEPGHHGGGASPALGAHRAAQHDRRRRPAKSAVELEEDEDHHHHHHHHRHQDSPKWAPRSPSWRSEELKPEYDAMDIYSSTETLDDAKNDRDHIFDPHSRLNSMFSEFSRGAIPAENSRKSVTRFSEVSASRPPGGPPLKDEFPSITRERRHFSERHPPHYPIGRIFHDSYGGNGSSIMSNSRCSSATDSRSLIGSRNLNMSFDAQIERAEELVRGAVDGLRFTYSPVSSAFVFTRDEDEEDEEGEVEEEDDDEELHDEDGEIFEQSFHRPSHYTPKIFEQHHSARPSMHFFDADRDFDPSRRFSESVDYAHSICSDDSFARGSEVPELGASRAESWSNVARGPPASHHQPPPMAFQVLSHRVQGSNFQDAVPSRFWKRRAGGGGHGGAGAGAGGTFESNADSSADLDVKFKALHIPEYPDARLIRRRPPRKSAMVTCLPFKSILRNFRVNASPGRSRLGPCKQENHMKWPSVANRLPY